MPAKKCVKAKTKTMTGGGVHKGIKSPGQREAKYTYKITKNINFNRGSVKFSCVHNQKMPNTMILISFAEKTSVENKYLLSQLLKTYSLENRCGVSIDVKLSLINITPGFDSIFIICPERFIAENICSLYSYLHTRHLSITESKNVIKGNYVKLSEELTEFEVLITGKCKAFIKQLEDYTATNTEKTQAENGSDKVVKMVKKLYSVKPNPNRHSFANNSIDILQKQRNRTLFTDKSEQKEARAIEQFYISIMLSDIPFYFYNHNIILLNDEDIERANMIFALPRKQNEGVVRKFLIQSGTYTSLVEQNPEKKQKKLDIQYMLHMILMKLKCGALLEKNDKRVMTDFNHDAFVCALLRYTVKK